MTNRCRGFKKLEIKNYVTQDIIMLKQDQIELLEMKNTVQQAIHKQFRG